MNLHANTNLDTEEISSIIRWAINKRNRRAFKEWMPIIKDIEYSEYEDLFEAAVPVFDYGFMYGIDEFLVDMYQQTAFGNA